MTCRTSEELLLYIGAKIGYWRGDIKGLVDDIGELLNEPSVLAVVRAALVSSLLLLSRFLNLAAFALVWCTLAAQAYAGKRIIIIIVITMLPLHPSLCIPV